MARYRTLKPQTFADEKLIECEVSARFLFVGLWCFVDDKGRARYHPKRIKLEVFPGDEKITAKVVDSWMRELDRVGVLRIYTIDGQTYFWIPNFARHQRIDRPSHSDIPSHPQDPIPNCECFNCKIARGEFDPALLKVSNHQHLPHNYSANPDKLRPPNVPAFTRGVLLEDSSTRGTLEEHSSSSKNNLITDIYINKNLNQSSPQNLATHPHPHSLDLPSSNAEHRRTLQAALDEIVLRMIQLLEIKHNSQLLQAVAQSVEMKARSKNISVEAAAQQVAARAAFVAAESPPEDWCQWFQDVGYEYVPQDDPRLKDRHVYARPVCGGSLCQEGWETVKVSGLPVLRRCPDCERLWSEGEK